MKKMKTIITALMLCTGIVMTFASCSDKNDDPIMPAAKNIEGVYHGDIICSVLDTEFVFEATTLTVAATDDATASITVSSFGEPPMQVPSFTVSGVTVSGSDGVYTLATTEFSGTSDTGKTYSGTMQGDFADNSITIRFNLHYGAMPMPMICSFCAPKE